MGNKTKANMRRCRLCGIVKPLETGFPREYRVPGGFQTMCKGCTNRRRRQQSAGSRQQAADNKLTATGYRLTATGGAPTYGYELPLFGPLPGDGRPKMEREEAECDREVRRRAAALRVRVAQFPPDMRHLRKQHARKFELKQLHPGLERPGAPPRGRVHLPSREQ